MNCPQCNNEMKYREGTSKAGKPYKGNFCTNQNCKHVEWIRDKKPQTNNEFPMSNVANTIIELLRQIEKNTRPNREDLPEGEPYEV